MDELLGEFIAETRETLEPLAGEIVAWEAEPGDRARLDSIFRFVHTVKGSCGFLDLPRLAALSHAAEETLAQVRCGDRVPDRRMVSAVLAIVDRIGALVEAMAAGEAFRDDDDVALIVALDSQEDEPAEPAAAGPIQAASTPRAPARSIRLPVELLDRMMAGVSDMVLARNELSRRLRERGGDATVDVAFERLSACVAEMRESITRTRMQRIDGLFSALPRMVRDISGELGKAVDLAVVGGDVELDREMIEMIRDPLIHIVRNAIDHGIETAERRRAAGKAAAGSLRVDARQSGNQILIEVADDGRGLDGEALIARAIAVGIIDPARAAGMRERERLDLIFAPGFSTANTVTAISGRGVGMDVVRANVERIGGTVEIENSPGRGLKLSLRVPMTLTIIPALTFRAGGEQFAIPRGAIDEIVRAGGGSVQLDEAGGAAMARIRGDRVPVVDLARLLGLSGGVGWRRSILIVVRASSGERYALAVDAVQDHEELVVKPAAPAIMATGAYAGTTLPDNGRPMLLIDPAGIAQIAGVQAIQATIPAAPVETSPDDRTTLPTLLFRSLDGVVRAVRLGLVERIEDVSADTVAYAGGRLTLAHEGRVLALFGLSDDDVRGLPARLRVLLLGDGTGELAYAVGEVIDIHDLPIDVTPPCEPGPIAGVVLVEGRQVELLDPYWLFGQAATPSPIAGRPLCVLDGEDPWMREVLRPIVEAAGYRTAFAAGGEDICENGAVRLVMDRGEGAEDSSGAAIVRLRATPDTGVASPNSIYRYDRGALIAALTVASMGK